MRTFHLISNAHIDPVWLWDWREGLNEGIGTCRAMLDLMDDLPYVTFNRGEAAIYEHIERVDPETFARIGAYVKTGRWDVVGGTYIQPDMNMPATETLTRHFTRAQRYFFERFGKKVEVAWAADSFGHSAGLPEILAAAGMRGFAYARPVRPTNSPVFWWEGPGGSRVLAYHSLLGQYATERDILPGGLDEFLASALKHDIDNLALFYGVGNHGGGPTRRQLRGIAEWSVRHPEIHVVHSGLHRYFEALYAEAAAKGDSFFPTHCGEINYCHRACYSSVAKFKFLYRATEAITSRAETTASIVNTALSGGVGADIRLDEAWDAVLFNSFHDILPGSSIERAYDDQIAWLGSAVYKAQRVEFDALNALAMQVNTSVAKPDDDDQPGPVPFLVWNPHPFAIKGLVELEASLDYRPLWNYTDRPGEVPLEVKDPSGQPVAFQRIRSENTTFPNIACRARIAAALDIAPFGWSVYDVAYREGAVAPAWTLPPVHAKEGVLDNGIYRIEAKIGESAIGVSRNGRPVFGAAGLSAVTVEDPYGAWGAMDEASSSLDLQDVRHVWQIEQVVTLEEGPILGTIWVRLKAGSSVLDLTISLSAGRDAMDVAARILWNDRSARLKLVMPVDGVGPAEYDVPGGALSRGDEGEVPAGRWVRVPVKDGSFGFASDALYNFNYRQGTLQATVVRGSRYSATVPFEPDVEPWTPAADRGELKFRFAISPGDDNLSRLARLLEMPLSVLPVPAKPGPLTRAGSLGAVDPPSLALLALKRAEDGDEMVIRLQNRSQEPQLASFTLSGARIGLGEIGPGKIASWRIAMGEGSLTATAVDSLA